MNENQRKSTANGNLTDGVDGSIKATVFDYSTSNPLAVVLRDTNGDYVSVGGGTQYTEDAAAAANPTGTMPVMVRQDTPATLVTTDGDVVAQRATNYGAAYTQLVTSTGAFIDSVGGGTEYTEDAAAAANPLGKATILVRQDTPATLTTTDGDNVAQRGTNYGAAYTQVITSAGAFVDTFGGGTQYTEDAASAANPVGNALIAIRDDALAGGLTTTDGDNVALRGNNKGELYVKHTDTVPATQSGTWTVQPGNTANTTAWKVDGSAVTQPVSAASLPLPTGAATSANQSTQITAEQAVQASVELIDDAIKADDAAFTPATTKVMMAGFEFDDVAPDSVDEGDAGAARMSANRNVYTQIRDAAGNERGVNVNASNQMSVSVDNTVTVASHAVTNAGTFAVQESGAALTALQLIDDPVATLGTTTYTEAATKGMIMGAIRRDADTTLVDTTNEVSPLQVDANGRLKVEVFSGETLPVSGTVAVTQSGTWDEVGINDSGNSITVDATDLDIRNLTNVDVVTAELSATDNAVLDAIAASLAGTLTVTGGGGGTEYTEDAAAAANPVGHALIMVREDARGGSLTTTDGDNVAARGNNKGELYVKTTDSDALLTTIDADTSALAGAVSGAGFNITQLGGAAIPMITTQADDIANTQDTLAVTAFGQYFDGTTWDRMKGDSTDGMLVNLGANNDITGTVTANAGTNLNTSALALETGGNLAASATSLALLDDTVATLGTTTYAEATTKGLIMGGVRRDADTTLVDTTNEVAPFQVDARGCVKVEVFSGETLPVSGTVTVSATDLDIRNLVNTDVVTAELSATDNAVLDTIDTSTAASATSLAIMDDWDNGASDGASVSGDVAHDGVDAGEPVKIGFKAYNFDGTAPQTAVAEADRVNAISTPEGIQYVETAHPNFWSVSVDYASAQTNATVKAAPGSGSLYVTDIVISNGATAGNVTLLNGSGGSVVFECYPGINGGVSYSPKNPIKLSATTLLAITSTTVTTHCVNVSGFIA